MLTRLRVAGFKNLVDADVRFGPFTSIAGANGIGKSNLFDAIHFLSLAADRPLLEAARAVRGGAVESLFHRVGDVCGDEISFAAEMLVPPAADDDLGQEARATITFLEYRLALARRPPGDAAGPLEIVREELRHIPKFEAHKHLWFPHSAGRWRGSVVVGERRAPYFISTSDDDGERTIHLHQDGGSLGRPVKYRARQLPRTVLSGAGAAESPTALVARRELASWRLLQLEPSALRRPDEFAAPAKLGTDGSHLAATLHRLARSRGAETVYAALAERLARLVDDVRGVRIERDERRGLLTLRIVDREGTEHPSPAISDGSLRFLALAVLELDAANGGLLCLEEPENGVHPERIPAMLQLLHDLAADVRRPSGPDNPLRQVIVNTHSPAVVAQTPEESLLVALAREAEDALHGRFHKVEFHPLPETWRARAPESLEPVPFGRLLAYLNPMLPKDFLSFPYRDKRRRVVDRDDVQQLFIPFQ